jgi:hypothetical protein
VTQVLEAGHIYWTNGAWNHPKEVLRVERKVVASVLDLRSMFSFQSAIVH